ncbi:MAG: ABC transporter permease [Micrococcales bacterium]|nr:ABC transporter permease [Micrococcales bacterium]
MSATSFPVRSTSPRPPRPTVVRLVTLVARREILAHVRTRSFWVSTAILLALVLGGILASSFLGEKIGQPPKVAAVPEVVAHVEAVGLTYVEVPDQVAAERAVRDKTVGAAVLLGADGALVVVGLDAWPTTVAQTLAVLPKMQTLEPVKTDEGMRFLVSIAFGIVFAMAAVTFGMTIAQNTVTEKQTRVVEILLSAVPTRALLAGKVIGNSVLALGQTTAIAAVAVLGLVVTQRDALLGQIGAPVAWFVLFFAVGFVLLASMFAASAALVSRQEDLSAVVQPVTWLVMTPYLLVVFFNSNPMVLTVMSYVPFSAPVGMPVRLFLGEASWWEPLLSLVVLVASTVLVVGVGARVYERSVLRMGTRVRLGEALRAR